MIVDHRTLLELHPDDAPLVRLMLLYPTQGSLELLAMVASRQSSSTWQDILLPWLQQRIMKMGHVVSGSMHEQAVIDTAREIMRGVIDSGKSLPPIEVGETLFKMCLLCISRGYSETERFPETAARIVSSYVAQGNPEAARWLGAALAAGVNLTGPSTRSMSELIMTMLGLQTSSFGQEQAYELATTGSIHRESVILSLAGCATPSALALWHNLATTHPTFVAEHAEAISRFAQTVQLELDRLVLRMTSDPEFSSQVLRPLDSIHKANLSKAAIGKVTGFVETSARWNPSSADLDPERLSDQTGLSANAAAMVATQTALLESSRLSSQVALSSDPFDSSIGSLASLPAPACRDKVLSILDTLRSIAQIAAPSCSSDVFQALLKALAVLPPDMVGGARADADAATLINKLAARHTHLVASGETPSTPPLPPEVVRHSLGCLGPQSRSALARLFPATCLADSDASVRITALRALRLAAQSRAGAARIATAPVFVQILASCPTDFPQADVELAGLLGVAIPEVRARGRAARFSQGFSFPTEEILTGDATGMLQIQEEAAPMLAATAILATQAATAGVKGGISTRVAAAVVTACVSRLLMAAVDSAGSDAESLPSPAVLRALDAIAEHCKPVLQEMAASEAGRARLDDLRRTSGRWSVAVANLVRSGILRPRLIGGGLAATAKTIPPVLVPDWRARSSTPMTGSKRHPAGTRYEFEMAPSTPMDEESTPLTAEPQKDYADVLAEFQKDTETLAEQADVWAARHRSLVPLPSAPPMSEAGSSEIDGVLADALDADEFARAVEDQASRASVTGSAEGLVVGTGVTWSTLSSIQAPARTATAVAPPPVAAAPNFSALAAILPQAPSHIPLPSAPVTTPVKVSSSRPTAAVVASQESAIAM
jgi:hypothetical protein